MHHLLETPLEPDIAFLQESGRRRVITSRGVNATTVCPIGELPGRLTGSTRPARVVTCAPHQGTYRHQCAWPLASSPTRSRSPRFAQLRWRPSLRDGAGSLVGKPPAGIPSETGSGAALMLSARGLLSGPGGTPKSIRRHAPIRSLPPSHSIHRLRLFPFLCLRTRVSLRRLSNYGTSPVCYSGCVSFMRLDFRTPSKASSFFVPFDDMREA